MFQPKAHRIVSVLALTAALSLLPVADASAARMRTAKKPKPAGISLLVQLQAELTSLWGVLQTIWSDAGVRMDDNG